MFKSNVSDCGKTLSDYSAEFLPGYLVSKRLNYPKINFAKVALPLPTAKIAKLSIIARFFPKRSASIALAVILKTRC
jgi:hypothetical protein